MNISPVNNITNIKTVNDLFKSIDNKLENSGEDYSQHLIIMERKYKNKDEFGNNINSIDIKLYKVDIENTVLDVLNKLFKQSVEDYIEIYNEGYNYPFHHKGDNIQNLNKFLNELAENSIDNGIYNLDKWDSTKIINSSKVKYGWIYLVKINHEILFFMENLDEKIIVENDMDTLINSKKFGKFWITVESGITDRFKQASENMFAISKRFFTVGYINIKNKNNPLYYCAVIRENDFDEFFNLKDILLSKAKDLINNVENTLKDIFEDDAQYNEFKNAILTYVKYYKKLARLPPDILTTDFSVLMQCNEIKKSLEHEGLKINESGRIELISNEKVPIEILFNLIICKEAISADGKKRIKSINPVVKTGKK